MFWRQQERLEENKCGTCKLERKVKELEAEIEEQKITDFKYLRPYPQNAPLIISCGPIAKAMMHKDKGFVLQRVEYEPKEIKLNAYECEQLRDFLLKHFPVEVKAE